MRSFSKPFIKQRGLVYITIATVRMSQERRNLLCIAGQYILYLHVAIFLHVVYIVVVMVIRSHALISVSRTLIIPTTDYAKFCCRSTSDSGSNEPVEWLNSNLDVLTTTDKIRIRSTV